jgi:uncharacterized membrane protein YhaH (DUF805 family)
MSPQPVVPRSHYVVAIASVTFVLVVLPFLVIRETDWSSGRQRAAVVAGFAVGAILIVCLALRTTARRARDRRWRPGGGFAIGIGVTGAAISAVGGLWRLVALSLILGAVAAFAFMHAATMLQQQREAPDR